MNPRSQADGKMTAVACWWSFSTRPNDFWIQILLKDRIITHIIYVNGAYKGDASTPLARLVHDLFCVEPDDMNYEELAERARYYKKDSKGVETMCEIWEEVRREGLTEGKTEGRSEDIKNLMQTTGWAIEKVMESLKIPEVE